ncbi:MAG: choice-of-anchor J domain-containing protein [Bacteroidales bacterium]|nr:choice-of-anchor J domain-containing protein [Candidatus Liminaster caballi]
MKYRTYLTAVILAAATVADAQIQQPTSPWHESFEQADPSDLFWLPEGWTSQRTEALANAADPHTWGVISQLNAFYPTPADGRYYAVAFYSDDAPQDEWIITPQLHVTEGDFLSYNVLLQPYWLYDTRYFDTSTLTYSQRVMLCDMQAHISVDGAEWQMIHSQFDDWFDADAAAIYEDAHNGYVTSRYVFIDMQPYAGHDVRLGFRYVGQGGNSIYLDDIRLGAPSITASYEKPASSLYFGMTADFRQPTASLYLPDDTPLTWRNTSSADAVGFTWRYADTALHSLTATSSARDLVTAYTGYVPASQQVSGTENTIAVPELEATSVSGQTVTFAHPAQQMVIGGKAQIMADGEILPTGASNCNPAFGNTILTSHADIPYFGPSAGSSALWNSIFDVDAGDNVTVTAFGSEFLAPAKAYTLRGVHVQGIGHLDPAKAGRLSVQIRHLDPIYGSLLPDPLATAVIDADHITSQPVEGTDRMLYCLPFLFADPVTVDEQIWVMVEGLDKASTWFAPLQTALPEAVEDDSHAVFEIEYTSGRDSQRGIYYASNLAIPDASGNSIPCAYNFHVNLDMAYGDCDDWGHIDIQQPLPQMPPLQYGDNSMEMLDITEWENGTAYVDDMCNSEQKPLRCGFYDESRADSLTLYVCIGELYEAEGLAFYSDKLYDTYFIRIRMPRQCLGDTIAIDGQTVRADYYSLLGKGDRWKMFASTGRLWVSETAPHVYGVWLEAMDTERYCALGARYTFTDAWRWQDFTAERPHPNQFELKKSATVKAHHDILSCVADRTDAGIPAFYFADQEGLVSVSQVEALDPLHYVRIQMPVSLMDGLIKGFSGWSNDDMTVTYCGVNFNHSGCQHDETCYGGNVQMVSIDDSQLNINSTVYTMSPQNKNDQFYMHNLYLHYEGAYIEDDGTAISQLRHTSDLALPPTARDLYGRPVRPSSSRPSLPVIVGGRKIAW